MASFIQKAKTLKPQGVGTITIQPPEAMQPPATDQGIMSSPVPLAKVNRPQELPKVAAPQTAQQSGDIIPTPPWSSQPLPASSPQAPFISDQAPQRQADTSQIDLKNLIRATLAEVMGTSGTQPMQNSTLLQPPVQTETLDQPTDVAREDPDFQFKQSFTPAEERPAELTQEEVLRPRARPEPEISSLRPRARPEGIQPITKPEVQNVIDILPTGLDESVQDKLEDSPPKTTGDVNLAIFDSATWDGTIPEIKKGENFIEYFARSGLIGADEKDPKFIEAYKNFGMGIDPSKTPWCADLLGSLILKSGGKLTEGAVQYRAGSQNYEFIGDDVYNHNPTTGETYFGSPSDVRAGDIVVFNNRQDGTRQKNGNFKYPSQALKKGLGLGHVSVVLDIKEDGTIIAIGGNQSAGATSYITGTESTGGIRVSEYTPEVMKNNYKGGFKIKRLTDTSLSQADPELIAAITKNAGIAGTGQ